MSMLAWAETVDQKITSGALPRDWPVVAGGNWGLGNPCGVCERAIAADQVQVRALFRNDDPRDFHVRCFVEWWRVVSEPPQA